MFEVFKAECEMIMNDYEYELDEINAELRRKLKRATSERDIIRATREAETKVHKLARETESKIQRTACQSERAGYILGLRR